MGKAAIYNPYLDTLGGGERYTLTFAKALAESGYEVDIEWKDTSIIETMSKRFGIKLPKNISIVRSVNRGENYDICFWVSDGSIPTLRSRENILHFQVPFKDVNGTSLLNKMKLFRVNKVICNSYFTKKVVDKEYGVDSVVIYPPVEENMFKPKRKENTICYVGRFSNLVQNKRHDILIDSFIKLTKYKEFVSWKLILAGGTEVGNGDYFKKLKDKSKNYNIELIASPSFNQLKDIYGKSKLFWSASGYDVDGNKNPEKTEHFGITLIEAMSAGCVPLIYKAGGHIEIVESGKNGYLWNSRADLLHFSKMIINESKLLTTLSKAAIKSVKKYDYKNFKNQVLQIIK